MIVYTIGELRGIEKRQSKQGNFYFVFHMEEPTCGRAYELVTREDFSSQSLKKGDIYKLTCEYYNGNGSSRLNLKGIEPYVAD